MFYQEFVIMRVREDGTVRERKIEGREGEREREREREKRERVSE